MELLTHGCRLSNIVHVLKHEVYTCATEAYFNDLTDTELQPWTHGQLTLLIWNTAKILQTLAKSIWKLLETTTPLLQTSRV